MLAPFRISALACAASAVALGAAALGGFGTDRIVERSVADAIDRAEMSAGPAPGARGLNPAHIHLSGLPVGPLAGAVAVGDRITLAQRTGGTATYEIVEVRPLSGDALGPKSADGPELMLVTAVTTAGHMPAQTIRFIFDGEAKVPAYAAKPHAL